MSIDKQQKRDKNDQPDWVDIGVDDDSWVCDGVWDVWAVRDNKRVYVPIKPEK